MLSVRLSRNIATWHQCLALDHGQCPPPSRLQHLSITCSKEIDSRRLLSSISLPRGVHIEVTFNRMTPKLLIDSLLPSPLTPIHDLLTPVTIFRTRDESHGFQVFGNGSSFTLNPPLPTWSALGRHSSYSPSLSFVRYTSVFVTLTSVVRALSQGRVLISASGGSRGPVKIPTPTSSPRSPRSRPAYQGALDWTKNCVPF